MERERITVFTPTYNRAEKLVNCFKSLMNQTNKNFIWLIVDDGSTDNTKKVVENFKTKANFKIEYYYKKNGGKHTAHNYAVKKCHTDYFLIFDSDDVLEKITIEVLNNKIRLIDNDENISGIIGNKFDINSKKVIGVVLPDIKIASGIELYQRLNFHGDTLRLYKTNILKKYFFPEIKGEKFVAENVVFDKIDEKYKMLIIHEKLYLSEYCLDGYSKNIIKIRINNPIGYSLSLKSTAETAITLKKKIGVTILYIMWNRKFKINNDFSKYKNKIIFILCYPLSLIFNLIKYPKFYFNMFKENVNID